MRLARTGAMALGLALTLAACAGRPVDPGDAAERAAGGVLWGATAGAALGATFAINPTIGAAFGAASGAAIGAATGVAAAQPAITYAPIAPASAAVTPGFYDSWAPGTFAPPPGTMVPPPPAGAG